MGIRWIMKKLFRIASRSRPSTTAAGLDEWVTCAVPRCEYWARDLGFRGVQCGTEQNLERWPDGRWLCGSHPGLRDFREPPPRQIPWTPAFRCRIRWHMGYPLGESETRIMDSSERGYYDQRRRELGE